VDEFFYPDKLGGGSERRKHIDRMLNGMDVMLDMVKI
jgi:hypothetical protein